tara:strand:+ start:395 stop:784 length:390 start_codon:yes stop_codon:yes gene_type:complete
MATLTPTLTLTSTDLTSDALSLSVTDSLTASIPFIGPSKIAIAASGGSVTALVPSGSDNQYVYIKHTGYQNDGSTATTNQLSVKFASQESLRLAAGEFAFFPSKSDVVVNVISSSSHTILIEYAYWTKA